MIIVENSFRWAQLQFGGMRNARLLALVAALITIRGSSKQPSHLSNSPELKCGTQRATSPYWHPYPRHAHRRLSRLHGGVGNASRKSRKGRPRTLAESGDKTSSLEELVGTRKRKGKEEKIEILSRKKHRGRPSRLLSPPVNQRSKLSVPKPILRFSSGNPRAVFCFGSNDCGELGLARGRDDEDYLIPNELESRLYFKDCENATAGIKKVLCAGMSSVGLTVNGTVYTWGVNDGGCLGRPAGNICRKKSPLGHLYDKGLFGSERVPTAPKIPTKNPIIDFTCGDSHVVTLDSKGAMFTWGHFRGSTGAIGIQPGVKIGWLPERLKYTFPNPIIKMVSGSDHVLAITRRGDLFSWGSSDQGQLGRVISERRKEDKRSLVPGIVRVPKMMKVRDVFAGGVASFAITENGDVYGWGLNNYGQLGLPPRNDSESIIQFLDRPTLIPSLTKLKPVEIATGMHHTLAKTADGRVFSFGRTTYGRLGREKIDPRSNIALWEPTAITGALDNVNVTCVAAGESVSGAIGSKPGEIFTWGIGSTSQLGKKDEFADDECMPYRVQFPAESPLKRRNVHTMSFGSAHVMMLADAE